MENIKGTIELTDKKITLKPYDGSKEIWIRKLNPEFEVGLVFIKHMGEYFFKKAIKFLYNSGSLSRIIFKVFNFAF